MRLWITLIGGLILLGGNMSSSAQHSGNLPTLFNDDGDGFVVIAHRGASAYYPENTMAAFKGAVEMNAEMIELDVLLSKDGIPVVIHDETLKRTTNGEGKVRDYTVSELNKLDAGTWFDSSFAGERIPTLEEVLEFSAGKIALNIEIKTEAVTDEIEGGVAEKSLRLVEKYGMEDHVIFSSFDYRVAEHLQQLQPDIPMALLYEKRQSGGRSPSELVSDYEVEAFNCSYRQLSNKWMEELKENGIPIFIYTVDQPRRMKSLLKKGVTGIFSNKPDVLRRVASERNQDSQDGML